MKMLKKLAACLLVLAMVLTVLPITANAATNTSGTYGSLTWMLNNGKLTISGNGYMPDATEDDWEYWVPWAKYADEITSVQVNYGVTDIGDLAFYNLENLQTVALASSVQEIGYGAFAFTTSLGDVSIPSVTYIGEFAFAYSGIKNLNSADNVHTVDHYAFYLCPNLSAVRTSSTLVSIGEEAFAGCYNLSSIGTLAYLNDLGREAFTECDKLTSVTVGNTYYIGAGAFYGCDSLQTVTIENNVGYINDEAFAHCPELTTVSIAPTVEVLGKGVFSDCYKLSSINLPGGIYEIGNAAFYHCTSLKKVDLPYISTVSEYLFFGCTALEEVTIQDSVYTIGNYAFSNCDNLKKIYFNGSSVDWERISIAENSKLNEDLVEFVTTCSGSAGPNVTWTYEGNGVLRLSGTGATYEHSSSYPEWYHEIGDYINVLIVEEGVTKLGYDIFYSHYNLTTVYLPKSLTTIEEVAFRNCPSLTTVCYAGTQSQWNAISIDSGNDWLLNANRYYSTGTGRATIVRQPEDAYGAIGDEVVISFEAMGDGLTYTWYYKDRNASSFSRTNTFTGNTYTAIMTEARNGRAIYCVVTDKDGNTATTNTVYLIKTTDTQTPLEIVTQPQSARAPENGHVTVSFQAEGEGLTYRWFYKNRQDDGFTLTTTFTSNTYTTQMNDARNGRQIYCEVSDRYGNTVTTDVVRLGLSSGKAGDNARWEYADGTLTITGSGALYDYPTEWPQWWCFDSANEVNNVVIGEGITRIGSYNFCVHANLAEAHLPSTLTYIEYGNFENGNAMTVYYNGSAANWQNITVNSGNEDLYHADMRYSVEEHPVAIVTQPQNVAVANGQEAKVSFTATGDGLTYKWYYKNKNQSSFQVTNTFTGNTYTATMNADRDGRQLYCVVTDKYGNSIQTDTVTISMTTGTQTPLEIVTQPQSARAPENGYVTVRFEAKGDGLTYKWYYCNRHGGEYQLTTSFTSNTYTTQMNDERNGRAIYCEVTDKYGNTVTTDIVVIGLSSGKAGDNATWKYENGTLTINGSGALYDYPGDYPQWWYFDNGYDVSKVVVNEGITYIGNYTFYQHHYMEEVYLPKSLTEIGAHNFCDEGLRQVHYNGTVDQWLNITVNYDNGSLDNADIHFQAAENAVRITTQPQSVSVANGQEARVSLIAQGDGLSFKWYYKNKGESSFKLTTTFTGNTYTAQMNAERDGRQLYCVVTDAYGNSVQSNTVTISMTGGSTQNAVRITTQPQNVSVANGQEARVSFTATGDGLTYKWYFKNKGESEFKLTTTFTGNTYTAQMNAERDGRQIYCVVTDRYGNTARTNTVTISMTGGSTTPQNTVRITTQPQSVTVDNGQTATVTFTATGDGLTYKWYFKNKGQSTFQLTTTFTGNTYTAQMNADRDGRQIYCVVTDRYGNSVQTNTVTISMTAVRNNVRITSQPQSVQVVEGRDANVYVGATGDGLTYKWYYKDRNDNSFKLTTSFTTNTYTVQMNASRNGRQLYCVVTDQYGNSVQTNTVTISMIASAKINSVSSSLNVESGQTAYVNINASGDGLTYQWYFKNKGATSFQITNSFTGPRYEIVMSADRDGRQVYCVVTDQYGNSVRSETYTLTMKKHLQITSQPQSKVVAKDAHVSVSFTAQGEGLTYKWYYKDLGASSFSLTTSFTTNTYTTQMNLARDGRQLYCVVTDKYGNSVQTNTVTISMNESDYFDYIDGYWYSYYYYDDWYTTGENFYDWSARVWAEDEDIMIYYSDSDYDYFYLDYYGRSAELLAFEGYYGGTTYFTLYYDISENEIVIEDEYNYGNNSEFYFFSRTEYEPYPMDGYWYSYRTYQNGSYYSYYGIKAHIDIENDEIWVYEDGSYYYYDLYYSSTSGVYYYYKAYSNGTYMFTVAYDSNSELMSITFASGTKFYFER